MVIKLIKEQKAYGRTQRYHTYNPTGRQKVKDKDYSGYVRHFVTTTPTAKQNKIRKTSLNFIDLYIITHATVGDIEILLLDKL